jgi:hypothetical protein
MLLVQHTFTWLSLKIRSQHQLLYQLLLVKTR